MADKAKPIVIGADHFGLPLKDALRDYMCAQGYIVEDLGVHDSSPVDYPDIALALALRVARGEYQRGVLVCGTGAGMAIAANKVPGVRAVAVTDPYLAERARASNNAQIITFGSQITTEQVAKKLIDIWLAAEFQGGRSTPKVSKLDEIDATFRCK